MKDVFLGLSEQYDTGSIPSVAINASGQVLEVHKNEEGFNLYYRLGELNKATVSWGQSTKYDTGNTPSVGLNNKGVAVEVHKNEAGSTLYYHVGNVSGGAVSWGSSHKYDKGIEPNVAVNDDGIVVEVHKTQSSFSSGLYYHVGQVNGSKIDWHSSHEYDSGSYPQVALNNNGYVVEVHQSQSTSTVWYHVGRVNGSKIDFGDSHQFGTGGSPSVALTDDGTVVVVYSNGGTLMQRQGSINGTQINWQSDAVEFDDGKRPSIGIAADTAVQVHPSETVLYGLWYSTSLLTNRAAWMQDRLSELGNRTVAQLALPASHDSGMYKGGLAILGKTQDLDIKQQLEAGVRYFDLRPKWTGSKFVIYHGPINGPDLSEVLSDIKSYCQQGNKELAILKFSHFSDIGSSHYSDFCQEVENAIGDWMVKTKPEGKRLAQGTLNEYVSNGPAMMVVIGNDLAINEPRQGFWVYKDWDSEKVAQADLTVFDEYSNTMSFSKMKQDQFEKFENFTGQCKKDSSVPCDLFLLSWTLTPPTAVWPVSKEANRALGEAMVELPAQNQYGKIVNMLYVDYVEYARVADVAIIQNNTNPLP
ncbi:phosphatidylinositol-specific phospholipase C domain-containing protein [Alteromonas sp. a30]|uniref:phosphatidylinositol-specific phospholipase C domain-containing protein n=1 Tax=Alteromonas sp. a30 TaxID=2730917 RepID=UPI002280DDD2|nr:phosphatidylinositol-specific phospholipase C domain-containing protein [Alteromonas sp. a30]MCY7295676.1 hypothetical protein [Alteromonas sp. a30]